MDKLTFFSLFAPTISSQKKIIYTLFQAKTTTTTTTTTNRKKAEKTTDQQ
jgi:hypothetical protein